VLGEADPDATGSDGLIGAGVDRSGVALVELSGAGVTVLAEGFVNGLAG
jgi:hypothetical protein